MYRQQVVTGPPYRHWGIEGVQDKAVRAMTCRCTVVEVVSWRHSISWRYMGNLISGQHHVRVLSFQRLQAYKFATTFYTRW